MLDGREYGDECSDAESESAKKAGLLVVFGYSDDNVELRGVIYDEVGAFGGTELFVTHSKLIPEHDDCECDFCGFEEARKTAKRIEAVWGDAAALWTFKTDIPHATFTIMEDGEPFCVGVVIDAKDLG